MRRRRFLSEYHNLALPFLMCKRLMILSLLMIFVSRPAVAQDEYPQNERSEAENRLSTLHQQVSEYDTQLNQTRQDQLSAVEQLQTVDNQIRVRETLVSEYRKTIRNLNSRSDSLRQSLIQLEEEDHETRKQYQERATHAYKYGRINDLALILSSTSINQMLIRIEYLRKFTQQRGSRLQDIGKISDTLSVRRQDLEQNINRNQALLAESRQEQRRLNELRSRRLGLVSELQSQRSTLEDERTRKIREATQLEAQLREIIAAENRARTRRNAANPNAAAETSVLNTAFVRQKGNLPWPADGVVTSEFGVQTHPVWGTKTENHGLQISTRSGASVKNVMEGTVASRVVIPGFGAMITIRHGDYNTIYGNFSQLFVVEGDRVVAGQTLGLAGTNAEPLGTALFFGIFAKNDFENPRRWLRRR